MRIPLKVSLIGIALALVLHTRGGGDLAAMDGPPRTPRPEPLTEVWIGRGRIAVPLKRIVLVRFGWSHCAVRFTKAYGGKTDAEDFAEYESWFQADGTGDLSKSNVVFTKGNLWWKAPIGIGRMWLIKRDREDIRCGPVTLRWGPDTAIDLAPKKVEGGHAVVYFAPTPWTSVSGVNVHDPRIRWYDPGLHGDHTPDIRIPIDELCK